MTDQSDHVDDVSDRPRHGEHEPGPGTVPAADLLAELSSTATAGHEPPSEGLARGDGGDEGVMADGVPAGDGHSGDHAAPVPAPVLVATGLGLHTSGGWVFRDVDLQVRPGTVTALVAPAGSGRSSLLLALTGRMRVTDGTLTIADRSAIADPRSARRRTAVARVADLIVPEERLTVAESITERSLIDGVRTTAGRAAFTAACSAMGVTVDDSLLVEHLPAEQQAMLALALAAVRPADVIVLDDTDAGVDAAGEREIYRSAVALAGTGPAIVTTTARRESLPDSVTVVDLAAPRPAPARAESRATTDVSEDDR